MATATSKGTEYVNMDKNHFVANMSIGTSRLGLLSVRFSFHILGGKVKKDKPLVKHKKGGWGRIRWIAGRDKLKGNGREREREKAGEGRRRTV